MFDKVKNIIKIKSSILKQFLKNPTNKNAIFEKFFKILGVYKNLKQLKSQRFYNKIVQKPRYLGKY